MSQRTITMPMARCNFGLERVDVTPPTGINHRSWGAAKHDASTGLHKPLLGSVLAFQGLKGTEVNLLISLDLGWLQPGDLKQLTNNLSSNTGLPSECIVITFSHTHAAGNFDPDRINKEGGSLIPGYLKGLASDLAVTIKKALSRIKPVEISFGYGSCDLAYNRDYWDNDNQFYVCGTNPDRPGDNTILVTKIKDQESGNLVATIINYGCHPTTLAWDNTLISPDYPGAMREIIEKETGSPCVFLLGACGDIGPRFGFVGETEVADQNGRQLGYAALSALEGLLPGGHEMHYDGPVISGATIGVWRHVAVDANRKYQQEHFSSTVITLNVPLLDLPTQKELDDEFAEWRQKEEIAISNRQNKEAGDCRAKIERITRAMKRIKNLPPGSKILPYGITLWRMGEAVLVMVNGEPYNLLQRELRTHFPKTAIIVVVMCNTNGTGGYLLPEGDYGKGLYQEQATVIGAGGLEKVIQIISQQLKLWDLN